MPSCAVCQALSPTHRCGGCKEVYYCNAKCQRKHWTTHKKRCSVKTGTECTSKKDLHLENADIKGLHHLGKRANTEYILLICGYIRDGTNKEAPFDIVQLIQSIYLPKIIEWKIDTNELNNRHKTLSMPSFEDKGCRFDIDINANLYLTTLLITTTHMDDIIESDVYLELVCDEPNIGTKFTKKQKNGDRITDRFIYLTFEKSELMQQLSTITFRIYIEVLTVVRKSSRRESFREIKLSENLKHEWKIAQNALKSMKKAELEPFHNAVGMTNKYLYFSPCFGLNDMASLGWHFEYRPKAYYADRVSKTGPIGTLSLNQLYTPPGVGEIEIKGKLTYYYCDDASNGGKTHEKCGTYNFEGCYGFPYRCSCADIPLRFDKLAAMDSLSFVCEINIVSVRDLDGNDIDKSEWAKYGVC